MDMQEEIKSRRKYLYEGGGAKEIEKQHKAGKLTVRERIDRLFDKGTFQEIDLWVRPLKTGFDIDERELPGDAVVTGIGRINNRPAYVYAQDFTVVGGTFAEVHRHKVTRIMQMARENGLPCIGIVDSGGERIHDRFGYSGNRPIGAGSATGGSSGMYFNPGINSGVIPQITVMLGPSYAGAAYTPTMADFYIMRNKTAFMSVASPQLLKAVTFADVTQEQLGGAKLHATTTGNADFLTETDDEALEICRDLIDYLPLNYRENPPVTDTGDSPNRRDERLLDIVKPGLPSPYDMHEVITSIVDNGRFTEVQKLFASSLIIGFARLNGHTVGIVANNPAENNGILNTDTCDKEARFIRCCDCFNIPLVFLIDTPGFISSAEEEQSKNGLLRTAPKPAFAISEATVPMLGVYIGRCFGLAHLIMGSLRTGLDFMYSWPTAQAARIAPEYAVEMIYRKEIESSENPDELRKTKLMELNKTYFHFPYHAAELMLANDIIDPRDTRPLLINMLTNLEHKKPTPRPSRKHSLIPR